MLRFDEKSVFNILLGFTLFWDYTPTNAIHAESPGVYTSDKSLNWSTIDKTPLNCHVIDGYLVNGIRQPKLFGFILDKTAVYKVFCQPETIHLKKNKRICFEYYNIFF